MRSRAVGLLGAEALAFWPVAWWYQGRTRFDADERWELLALAAAVVFLIVGLRSERGEERPRLALPSALLAVYALSYAFAPPLVLAFLAVATMAVTAAELIVGRRSLVALGGLLALALPIIPVLQYQLGYPLRVATASIAAPLLRIGGFDVVRVGTCLDWSGRLIWVDAPCSGVRMLWSGLFLTFALAAFLRLSNGRTLAAGLVAFACLMLANVMRTAALFYVEADIVRVPEWAHAGTGVAVYAATAIAIYVAVQRLREEPCAARPSI